jgi:hypothetical protein
MRRRRFTKWAKWACTVVALAAVAAVVFGRFWGFQYTWVSVRLGTVRMAGIEDGLLGVNEVRDPTTAAALGRSRWYIHGVQDWYWGVAGETSKGLGVRLGDLGWHGGIRVYRDSASWGVGVTLAYPLLVTTLLAALLWHMDRRRFGPGHCGKCGYDRRGLAADAKCPECGAAPSAR